MKDDNKPNDTIAHPHTLFFINRQLMLLILSKNQTTSRFGLSELLVIMSRYDLDVNFQASDSRKKFLERCVCCPRTCHHYMALGSRLWEGESQTYTMGSPTDKHN